MREQWLKHFERLLDRAAPTITATGHARSRNIEDYYQDDAEVERQCYSDVYCYAQAGLSSFEEPIFKTLSLIHSFQNDRERGHYTFHIRWFGSENDYIRKDSFLADPSHDMRFVAKDLCKIAGTACSDAGSLVPNLQNIQKDDLVIFLCHDPQVRMKTTSRGKYRSLRRSVFWLFLGNPEPNLVKGIEFEPDFLEESQLTA